MSGQGTEAFPWKCNIDVRLVGYTSVKTSESVYKAWPTDRVHIERSGIHFIVYQKGGGSGPSGPSGPFAHSPIRPFAHSPTRPFAHSPIRPFAHSPNPTVKPPSLVRLSFPIRTTNQ